MNEKQYNELVAKVGAEAAEKIKSEMENFKAEFKATLEAAQKGTITQELLDTKLTEMSEKINVEIPEELKGLTKKEFDEIAKAVRTQGESINAIEEKGAGSPEATKTLGQIFMDTVKNAKLTEEISIDGVKSIGMNNAFVAGQKSLGRFELEGAKAAIDMTIPATMLPGATPGTSIGYLTAYAMQNVQLNLTKDMHLIGIIPTTPTGKPYFGVVIEYSETDGADVKAENVTAALSSFLMKTVEYKVFDVVTKFNISENQLNDIEGMAARIDRLAPDRIMQAIDEKALQDGGDNSTDIRGMRTSGQFTAFVPATYTATVQNANKIDVICKMKLQAELADQDVNIVILHPADISEIRTLKDADNNNLIDRRLVFDANGELVKIDGLLVVKNKKISTNEAIVMWNEAAEFGMRQDIGMTIGTENDDLSKRMRTILFIARVAFGPAKTAAIIYEDDLDASEAIIDIP